MLRTVRKNLEDFEKLLDLSKKMWLGVFRLGSNVIPFASHPAFDPSWFDELRPLFNDFAPVVKRYGVRITMHPGQFVVLNSERRDVVENSLRELRYHFWVLEQLGVGPDGVVVVHVGGVYGNKASSLIRFLKLVKSEVWLTERLAVENDERLYTVSDLLPVIDAGLPIVFDAYHHRLNPSEFDPRTVMHSWRGRTPEFHLSSLPEKENKFGEHGEWVRAEDFLELLETFAGFSFDVIVEAKGKERAIEKLRADLRGISHLALSEVIHLE